MENEKVMCLVGSCEGVILLVAELKAKKGIVLAETVLDEFARFGWIPPVDEDGEGKECKKDKNETCSA